MQATQNIATQHTVVYYTKTMETARKFTNAVTNPITLLFLATIFVMAVHYSFPESYALETRNITALAVQVVGTCVLIVRGINELLKTRKMSLLNQLASNPSLYSRIHPSLKSEMSFLRELICVNYEIFEYFPKEIQADYGIILGRGVKACCKLGADASNLRCYVSKVINSLKPGEPHYEKKKKKLLSNVFPDQIFQRLKTDANGNKEKAKQEIQANPFVYIELAADFPSDLELAQQAIEGHPLLYCFLPSSIPSHNVTPTYDESMARMFGS